MPWEPARPLQRSLQASGARSAEKVSKMSPRASGPRTPKSLQKGLGDSPGSLWRVSGKCLESFFLECSGTFSDFLGVRGPEAPGDIFSETFSAFRGRRARETSVRGGLVPKSECLAWRAHNDVACTAPTTTLRRTVRTMLAGACQVEASPA